MTFQQYLETDTERSHRILHCRHSMLERGKFVRAMLLSNVIGGVASMPALLVCPSLTVVGCFPQRSPDDKQTVMRGIRCRLDVRRRFKSHMLKLPFLKGKWSR